MVPVPEELLNFIRNGAYFAVVGHEEPDGDCIGSQLAISSMLLRMGKKAVPCSAGPFKRNDLGNFAERFLPFPAEREGLKVLILDCSARERVGELPIDGLPWAVIDHHTSGNPEGGVQYLDPSAPSVTFMVEKIFRALGAEITAEEAEFLLFGLCTDTGFFRHLDETRPEAFLAAYRLCAAGASPKKLFDIINGGKQLSSRLLLGSILAKTRPCFGGKLLVSDETLEERERFGPESRDSDMLYQLLQSVECVEAIVLIRQENKEECSIGFRSRDRIDSAAIAKQFGGGGHKNAAGAKVRGGIAELEEKVVTAFGEWFI